MTTTEKMLRELRDALPITRRLMLADIAKVYGEGFAESLRKQIDAAIEAKRK